MSKKPVFAKEPLCEKCGQEPATSFSYFRDENEWMFTGDCTRESEDYYIEFYRFFRSPAETVDWLAHMSEKGWMNWDDFISNPRSKTTTPSAAVLWTGPSISTRASLKKCGLLS